MREIYRYTFAGLSPFEDIMRTLDLALVAVQGIHGESRARLDVRFADDPDKRTIVIDNDTHAGEDLNLVFVAFVRRQFMDAAVHIERLVVTNPTPTLKEK